MESNILVPGEHHVASNNRAIEQQQQQQQQPAQVHHHQDHTNQSKKSARVPIGGDDGDQIGYDASKQIIGRQRQNQQQDFTKGKRSSLAPVVCDPIGAGESRGEPSLLSSSSSAAACCETGRLPGRRECELLASAATEAEANSSSKANFKVNADVVVVAAASAAPSANQLNEKAINNISSSGNDSNRRQAASGSASGSNSCTKPASNKGLRQPNISGATSNCAKTRSANTGRGSGGDDGVAVGGGVDDVVEVGFENCAPDSNETLSIDDGAVGCNERFVIGEPSVCFSQPESFEAQARRQLAVDASTTTTTTTKTKREFEPPIGPSGINHQLEVQLINTTTTIDQLPPCTCEAIRASRRHLDYEQSIQHPHPHHHHHQLRQRQQNSNYPINVAGTCSEVEQSNQSVDSLEATNQENNTSTNGSGSSSGPQNQDNYFWTRLANLTKSITQRHDHRHLVDDIHPNSSSGSSSGAPRLPVHRGGQQQAGEPTSLGSELICSTYNNNNNNNESPCQLASVAGGAAAANQPGGGCAIRMTASSDRAESEAVLVGGQAHQEGSKRLNQANVATADQQHNERRHSSAIVSQHNININNNNNNNHNLQQQQQQQRQQRQQLDTRLINSSGTKLITRKPINNDGYPPPSRVCNNQDEPPSTQATTNATTMTDSGIKQQQQIKLSIATTTTTTTTTTTATTARSSTTSVSSSLSSCMLSESSSTTNSEVRLKWGKKMDFLLSIIGFAVDLANIWRFPYLVYKNGGGVFLIPYGTMLIFGGIPLFFLELCLGQFVKKGPITVWNKICPSMKGVGYCSILISWYVSFYYNVLIAWSVYFIYRSILSFGDPKMPWEDCDNSWNSKAGECVSISQLKALCSMKNESLESCRKDMFASVNVTSPASEFFVKELSQIDQSKGLDDMGYLRLELVLCTMIVYLLHYFSLFRGLETSGKVVWVTATAPYMILSILLVRGLFLPGAAMGIEYYLSPKLEKLADPQVWIDAAGQVFYSIGVGFGVHLTYASFNSHDNNCYRDCLMTSAVNAATSVYSGLVVFVYLGYMATNLGIEIDKVASEGYSLVFEVYPEALTTLPFARFWSILFFIMLLTLGIDSAMGGLEAVITGLEDEFKFARRLSRAQLTGLVIVSSFLPALISCTQGGAYTLFWFDIYSAGVSLLFSALFETIGVVYCYGLDKFILNIESMLGRRPHLFFILCWKYISPVFLGVVIFMSLYTASVPVYRGYTFPLWSIIAGWCLAFSSVAAIPIVAIWTWFNSSRNLLEKRKRASGTDSVASGKHSGSRKSTSKHQFKSITVSCNSNNARGQGPFGGSTTTTTVLESSPSDHHHHYSTDAAMMPTRISEDML